MNVQNNPVAQFKVNSDTVNGGTFLTRLHNTELPQLTSTTNFNAVAEPVYMRNHETGTASQIQNHRVIRRDDTGNALGIVGRRYGIAQNAELYEMLTSAARDTLPPSALKGAELKEVASHGGAYTRFELAFPEMRTPIRQRNSETELKFRVGISNTFDGNGAVRVFAGAYDLVCENGMTIGEAVKQYARHTSGFTPSKFSEFLSNEMARYLEKAREWQRWADLNISPDQAETVLKDSGLSERRVTAMVDQFHTETMARGSSVWALYSALTFYASHNSERFAVRNSANADNTGATLETREREVTKLITGKAWSNLIAEAA
jgi:hypothetical protein